MVLPYVFIHDSSSLHHYCVFLRKVSALYTTLLADDSSKHAMLVPPSLWRALTCLLTLPLFLSLLVENFGPRWPTEDGPEVLRKCHGQAVCCMPNTYASREASTLKTPRKQEGLRENRGWWESGTLVSLHTHFCCLGEWPATVTQSWK